MPGLVVLVAFAFALRGEAACKSTAPTEKPTRLRAGMVIWLPPRMDLTLRAAILRRFQVPKPIKRTSLPLATSSRTTRGEGIQNLVGFLEIGASLGCDLVNQVIFANNRDIFSTCCHKRVSSF